MIVIGGGPAGLAAASECGRSGLSTVLFEGNCLGGILTRMCPDKRIDNYPGLGRPVVARELASSLIGEALDAGADLVESRVDGITRDMEIRAGDLQVNGKAMILASGSTAAEAGIRGEVEFASRGKGICYSAPDPSLFRGKRVVVIGGGDTAISHVRRLSGFAGSITLVHRHDVLRGILPLPEEHDMETELDVILGAVVEEFLGNERLEKVRIRRIATGEETDLAADSAIIAAGRRPNTSMFAELGLTLDPYGSLWTDSWQRTSAPGIFAVGDVASPLKMIVTAVSQGVTAAHRAYAEIREAYWK